MSTYSLLLLAFGLSMDAFAVSITSGIMLRREELLRSGLKVSAYFGFFQALMPLIGWFAGLELKEYIAEFDHWIAFILLGFIGAKMIYESLKKEDINKESFDPLNNKILFFLAVATSIDALAAGISFAFLKVSILESITMIGVITFFISFFGIIIGKNFGQILKKKAEFVGGLVLVLIGIEIVLEHTNKMVPVLNFFKEMIHIIIT